MRFVKIISAYFIAFMLYNTVRVYGQSLNAELLYEKAKEGVVIISTPTGNGSGFLVNENGYIVTNHHVIYGTKRASDIRVSFVDGKTYVVTEVVDYLHQSQEDLALLKIQPVPGRTLLPIFSDGEARVGAEVAVIGSPLEYQFTLVRGDISSLKPYENINYTLQFSAPVNPGNSGGPVLNRNGLVVGCVVSRRELTTGNRPVIGVNFATNSNTIRTFLNKNRVSYRTDPIIQDIDLKRQDELSEEEKLVLKEANIARIRQQQQVDSLRMAVELKRIQDELEIENQRLERQRLVDNATAVERARIDSLRMVEQRIQNEARIQQRQE